MINFFKKIFGLSSKDVDEVLHAYPLSRFPNVVVGEIKEITKHPNADKLHLTKINIGNNKVLDIVCGAPNIEVGQKVPCALIGAKLPDGTEIKEASIRGEKSFGMLCAEDELGLGSNHAGILILPNNAKVGDEIDKYLKK